jgi:hypothetical protein
MEYWWKEFFRDAGAGYMKENKYWKREKDMDKSSVVCRDPEDSRPHMVDDFEKGEVYREEMYPVPKIWAFSFAPFRRHRPLNK